MKLFDLVVRFFFSYVILTELIIKYVIGFSRFVKISDGSKGSLFSMFNQIGLCVGMKIFFSRPKG